MPLSGTPAAEILPVFMDLGNRLGFYYFYPGAAPVIYMHEFLLVGNDLLRRAVYRRLMEFHESIPPDSWQRGFPFFMYYGDLEPPVSWPQVLPEESVMMLSCFTRSPGSGQVTTWQVRIDKFRLMG